MSHRSKTSDLCVSTKVKRSHRENRTAIHLSKGSWVVEGISHRVQAQEVTQQLHERHAGFHAS